MGLKISFLLLAFAFSNLATARDYEVTPELRLKTKEYATARIIDSWDIRQYGEHDTGPGYLRFALTLSPTQGNYDPQIIENFMTDLQKADSLNVVTLLAKSHGFDPQNYTFKKGETYASVLKKYKSCDIDTDDACHLLHKSFNPSIDKLKSLENRNFVVLLPIIEATIQVRSPKIKYNETQTEEYKLACAKQAKIIKTTTVQLPKAIDDVLKKYSKSLMAYQTKIYSECYDGIPQWIIE